MGLFSMSGRKKHRSDQGSGYYQPQGFMGKLGGFMGSFSSSARKRHGYGQPAMQQPYPQQGQPMNGAPAPQISTSGATATATCPACKAQVPAGSKFCLSCGEKIGGGFCAECGATVPPTAKFCPECGTPRA